MDDLRQTDFPYRYFIRREDLGPTASWLQGCRSALPLLRWSCDYVLACFSAPKPLGRSFLSSERDYPPAQEKPQWDTNTKINETRLDKTMCKKTMWRIKEMRF